MSISDNVAQLRAAADVTMPMAAAEQVKNEIFELTRQTAMILGDHPGQADIEGPAQQAQSQVDTLIAMLAALSGAVEGVADSISRGR
ncbi:hypothetical protein ACIBCH_20700 [Amycolatopsis thailandensis]|uniref:hypothetical protein n=1 Tax=Amycolatopsis thailandensis TaxID=589330 RepID=UPI0037B6D10A